MSTRWKYKQFQSSRKPKCNFLRQCDVLHEDLLVLFLELHSCFGSLFCESYFANVMGISSEQILVNGADNTFISLSELSIK